MQRDMQKILYHKMELKKHQLLLSALFLQSVSIAAARTITELKLQTSCIPFSGKLTSLIDECWKLIATTVPGCDFCSISATIVPGPDQECTTPVLDNPGDNDLQTCDENVFSGPVIGEVSIGIVIL